MHFQIIASANAQEIDLLPSLLRGHWWNLVPWGMLDWQLQFLADCWPQATPSSLAHGLLCKAADNMAPGFLRMSRWERTRESAARWRHSLYNLILEVTSHHICHIHQRWVTRSNHHSRERERLHKGMNSRMQGSLGAILEIHLLQVGLRLLL